MDWLKVRVLCRVLTVVLALPLYIGCGRSERAVGDGWLKTRGGLSYYPKHSIYFEPIEIIGEETRSYELRDFPRSRYSFVLEVFSRDRPVHTGSQWDEVWEALRSADARARVMISTGSGELLAEFGAPLGGGWEPGARGENRLLATPELSDIPLGPGEGIKIELTVRSVSTPTSGVYLRPQLVGGGIR